jgi:hypothetical protein
MQAPGEPTVEQPIPRKIIALSVKSNGKIEVDVPVPARLQARVGALFPAANGATQGKDPQIGLKTASYGSGRRKVRSAVSHDQASTCEPLPTLQFLQFHLTSSLLLPGCNVCSTSCWRRKLPTMPSQRGTSLMKRRKQHTGATRMQRCDYLHCNCMSKLADYRAPGLCDVIWVICS